MAVTALSLQPNSTILSVAGPDGVVALTGADERADHVAIGWTPDDTDLVIVSDHDRDHPAIFALTREPLIVFTSNIFAILGLRALYFLLADMVERFALLKYGLAAVLIFVGLKMVWLNGLFDGKFPILWSLAIIGAILTASIIASLALPVRRQAA